MEPGRLWLYFIYHRWGRCVYVALIGCDGGEVSYFLFSLSETKQQIKFSFKRVWISRTLSMFYEYLSDRG